MKKTKLLKSFGIAAALAMPAATVMTTLASCGNTAYIALTSEIKDAVIEEFISFCKTVHRNVWDEQEAFDYVKTKMQGYGIKPAGFDHWSQIPIVQKAIKDYHKTQVTGENPRYGNIWFDIPASAGMEDAPKIMLHAHLDAQMSFKTDDDRDRWVKTDGTGGTSVYFDKEVDLLRSADGDGTSLGADNGLGIILLLTLAKMRNEFKHPGLRLLFTAGESEAVAGTTPIDPGSETTIDVDFAAGASFLYNDQAFGGKLAPDATTSYLDDEFNAPPFGTKSATGQPEFKYIISTAGTAKNNILRSSAGIHECATVSRELELNVPFAEGVWHYDSNKIDWDATAQIVQPELWHMNLYKVEVSGLHGGHSATDANKGYANAVNLLMSALSTGDERFQIIDFKTGEDSAYAYPQSATCIFASMYPKHILETRYKSIRGAFIAQYPGENWDVNTGIQVKLTDYINEGIYTREQVKVNCKWALSSNQSYNLVNLCANQITFGVVDWFDPNTRATPKCSINYGPLNVTVTQNPEVSTNKSEFEFHVVCRSADDNQLWIFYNTIHRILDRTLASIFGSEIYLDLATSHLSDPVWGRGTSNKMVDAFVQAYEAFKVKYEVKDEHGWAEIACLPSIYTDLGLAEPEMTVIGPEIIDSHTINEKVYTDTLTSEIETLLYVLINAKNLFN